MHVNVFNETTGSLKYKTKTPNTSFSTIFQIVLRSLVDTPNDPWLYTTLKLKKLLLIYCQCYSMGTN